MFDKDSRGAEISAPQTIYGNIDSVYCGSGVDGAGLRCVVFFAGCNLRCPFCHNPETLYRAGTRTEAGELVEKLVRYKPYFKRGGVTLSGGEPFLQKEFCLILARLLKERGVRVAFETNGRICDRELIAAGDIICDVKNQETDDLAVYDRFFAECVKQGAAVQVTNVLVPGKNDGEQKLAALARLVKKYFPQEKIVLLPFRKLCTDKYKEVGKLFPYAELREAEESDVERAYSVINKVFGR